MCQLWKNWPKTSVPFLMFITRLSLERGPTKTPRNRDGRRKKKEEGNLQTHNEIGKQNKCGLK
jgi:hypothetical protein